MARSGSGLGDRGAVVKARVSKRSPRQMRRHNLQTPNGAAFFVGDGGMVGGHGGSDDSRDEPQEPRDPDVWSPPESPRFRRRPAQQRREAPAARRVGGERRGRQSGWGDGAGQGRDYGEVKRSKSAKKTVLGQRGGGGGGGGGGGVQPDRQPQGDRDPRGRPSTGAERKRSKSGAGKARDRPWIKGSVLDEPPKDADPPFVVSPEDQHLADNIETTILTGKPDVSWDAVCGLEYARKAVQMTVELPLKCPQWFEGGRKPPSGLLLFGPPGTGKTMIAKAIATECDSTFFNITSGSIGSRYLSESQRLVSVLFQMARHKGPSVIFCDEIDSFMSQRGQTGEHETSKKVKAAILQEMDGMNTAIANAQSDGRLHTAFVIGATNHPWDLDDAILRRFQKRLYIPLPNAAARRTMVEKKMEGANLAPDVDLDRIMQKTEGFSGADIASLCAHVMDTPMDEYLSSHTVDEAKEHLATIKGAPLPMAYFEKAFKVVKALTPPQLVSKCEAWDKHNGTTGTSA